MIQTSTTEKLSVQFQVLSDDQVWAINRATFEIMAKVGFKVLHEGARKMLKDAGASVKGELVKVPEHVVRGCLATAPKGFTIYDREGRRAMEVEGRKSFYGTSTASPNTKDARTGEIHPTRVEDIALGAKVADALPNIDWVMPMGSSQDVPALAADVYEFEAVVTNTTKPMVFIGYSARGSELVFEMAARVAGSLERLQERPFLMLYPEPISPLVQPAEVIERILVAADLNLPQIPGPSIQPGGTGPVSLAGAVAQGNAESLMCLVLAQLRKPGCPVALGANFGILDMATALMSMGAPEMSLGLAAQAQTARSFGLPTWGLAGATDAKALDAQAGIESAFSVLAQGLAGLNLIHDVGYMDMGMVCSCEMLVMGDEVIGMARRFLEGITVNPETLAREVVETVGPGGNFLQQRHTLENFRRELWRPTLLTRQPYGTWQAEGAKTMEVRVKEKLARIIETHQPPALPDETLAALAELREKGARELAGE